jgi:hypothetical protein
MNTAEQPSDRTALTNLASVDDTATDLLLTEAQLEEAQELKRLSSAAQQGERDRIAIGRRLAAARPAWPKSGPRAVGWKQFLDKVGIEKRTAQRYMRAASSADKVRDTVSQKPRLTLLERTLKLARQLPANDRAVVLRELQQAA